MTLPRAILFDHDGVLVASEPLHWSAWEVLLRQIGIPYVEAELRSLVGKPAPLILLELLNRHKPGWDPDRFDLNALALSKNDIFLQLAPTQLQAYPGVRDGIVWLKTQGVKTAVVSNAKRRELEAGLAMTGLLPLVDLVLSRDDVRIPKPDPMPYLTAAAMLEIDPARCLVVEDSPTGLEAGLLAKIPTAAVMTNFARNTLELPVPGRPDLKPAWIGESMAELFTWLSGLPRA